MREDNFDIVFISNQTYDLLFARNEVSKRQKTPCHLKVGCTGNSFQVPELGLSFSPEENGLWHLPH